MRNFATVPPSVWGTDIKKLRGDTVAIAIYYYLTTCTHSTMIGIYPLPVMFISYELGIPLEGASKGLRRVCEAGLATYDDGSEIVWVHEMAATQVAPRLAPKDNKVAGVAKQLAMLPICPITLDFYKKYREAFHLNFQFCLEEFERGFQGASEALRSKEKEKDKEKEQEQDLGTGTEKWAQEEEKRKKARAQKNDDPELPYDPSETIEKGRIFVTSIGVPPQFIDQALHRHMRGALFPCDVANWQTEARGEA